MRQASFLFVMLSAVSGNILAERSPVNLATIAEAFQFPASELTMQDETEEQKRMDGEAVISSHRITARTEHAFYPILVTVARAGTLVTEETERLRKNLDEAPNRPITEGGRGPLGSLTLHGDLNGGLYIGEIRIPRLNQPMKVPARKMAMYSVVKAQSKQIDARIAVLAAFSDGHPLVEVPGGEGYYNAYRSPNPLETDGSEGKKTKLPVDLRKVFTMLNKAVFSSALVAGLNTSAETTVKSPPATTPQQ